MQFFVHKINVSNLTIFIDVSNVVIINHVCKLSCKLLVADKQIISNLVPLISIQREGKQTRLYLIHVELAPCIALIHCAIRGCTACTIDRLSLRFWYGILPCPITFEGAKLLATSTSTLEWHKSHAHISFLSKVIQIIYAPTQRERGIVLSGWDSPEEGGGRWGLALWEGGGPVWPGRWDGGPRWTPGTPAAHHSRSLTASWRDIHMYMYVTHIHIHTCTHTDTYTRTYSYTYTHTYMYTHTHTHTHTHTKISSKKN